MHRYISEPLDFPVTEKEADFTRADLQFRGVDHSGPSFEARIFLDNPDADASTPADDAAGYAGSFHIFGHGGCFGDLGHCEIVHSDDPFDRRPQHQLTPYIKTVTITDALRRARDSAGGGTFTITVVAIVADVPTARGPKRDDVLDFESVSLVSYE